MKEGKHAKQKFQVVELYTVLLLVAFVFMSIGYAQISDIDMIISGQATATAQNGVFIYDVGEASAGGGLPADRRVHGEELLSDPLKRYLRFSPLSFFAARRGRLKTLSGGSQGAP